MHIQINTFVLLYTSCGLCLSRFISPSLQVTYTPRLIAIDLKGRFTIQKMKHSCGNFLYKQLGADQFSCLGK